MFSIIWMLFTPLLLLCGIAGGIFLMVTGIKYRKLLVGLMGLLSLSFVTLPFVLLSVGIHIDTIFPIPTALYWILFSLTGLLAGVSGVQAKIKSIRNMGFIIFTTEILSVIFWELMSVGDSFYI
ncbi:DNA-binding protein [Bacillus tropicus]|uniref:DNA-binding protein n=1 Tax=Bacillus TaxID=1386 RepID=UPI0009421305|nr:MULTISPECIES: DNA-binding protein [Bacillus cereus group]OOL10479.1 DNA-binding protein [Bacillus cereus]MDA1562559.1 DNA-binding protein [Bacillus cereus group sp. TH243-1LC]MDA1640454.1 DNA-binding protein [Bacillus cereus group sp. TH177-1LC]MDA1859705.1 DNA-binding protein [Bacillus cereus group sp. BY122LC]MEC2552945.1 DNA-binding protein [Bacillus tropicus]